MEIKHQSEVIEWLRFILAVIVVFMHAPIIYNDFFWSANTQFYAN